MAWLNSGRRTREFMSDGCERGETEAAEPVQVMISALFAIVLAIFMVAGQIASQGKSEKENEGVLTEMRPQVHDDRIHLRL